MTVDCQSCDFTKGFFVEREGNPIEFQQLCVLFDDGVLRFGQDATEGFFVKFIEGDGILAFVLAPGAFLALGYLLVIFKKLTSKKAE